MSLLALVVATMMAGEPPAGLTVDDVAARATRRALQVQALAARANEEEARGGLGVRLPDWQLRVGSVSARRVLSPLAGQGAAGPPLQGSHVGVRFHTPTLQAFSTEHSIARHRADHRRALAEVVERDVAHVARQLHTAARRRASQLAFAERRVAVEQRRLVLFEQQVAAGLKTRDAVDAQRLQLLRRRARVRALSADHDAALLELATLIEAEVDQLALIAPDGDLCRAGADPGDAAPTEAPEVRAWRAQAAEASAAQVGGWMRLMPWPDFVQLRYEVGATRAEDDVTLLMGFSLPVGDLGAGEARAQRHRARWMGMQAQAEAQRIASAQRRAATQVASAAQLVTALDAERVAVDDIRRRLDDPAARAALPPEAALDLEVALLEHEETRVLAQAQCEAAMWDQIRLGVRLNRAARSSPDAGR